MYRLFGVLAPLASLFLTYHYFFPEYLGHFQNYVLPISVTAIVLAVIFFNLLERILGLRELEPFMAKMFGDVDIDRDTVAAELKRSREELKRVQYVILYFDQDRREEVNSQLEKVLNTHKPVIDAFFCNFLMLTFNALCEEESPEYKREQLVEDLCQRLSSNIAIIYGEELCPVCDWDVGGLRMSWGAKLPKMEDKLKKLTSLNLGEVFHFSR